MSNANEVVSKLFRGDEDGAAEALSALTDPHRVADQVRRQMATERALADFTQANPDIAGDRLLAGVADMHLAQEIGGRRFDALAPGEAADALAKAGARTRDWLRRVAPRAAPEPAEVGASSIIERMRRARGQG